MTYWEHVRSSPAIWGPIVLSGIALVCGITSLIIQLA